MWNASPNTPKSSDIADAHWRILEDAVRTCADSDPRRPEVYAALDYFHARVLRHGGLNLFRAGMRDSNIEHLVSGLRLLRKHLGGVIDTHG